MRVYQNKDFYRAKTYNERLYYAAQVPHRFWHSKPGDPKMKDIWWGKTKLSATTQMKWFERLQSGKMFRKPHLIIFASEPSDEIALAQAFHFCKRVVRTSNKNGIYHRVNVQTVSKWLEDKENERNATCDLYVLQNVTSSADKARVSLVRDWIRSHDDKFRILVIAGHPYEFHCTYGIEPTAAFLFDNVTKFVKSFA